jgi:hypothetical protein
MQVRGGSVTCFIKGCELPTLLKQGKRLTAETMRSFASNKISQSRPSMACALNLFRYSYSWLISPRMNPVWSLLVNPTSEDVVWSLEPDSQRFASALYIPEYSLLALLAT